MDQKPYLFPPSAQWSRRGTGDQFYHPAVSPDGDREDPVRGRLIDRVISQRALRDILGICFFDTNILIGIGAEWIGPCWFNGKKLSFSIWAPQRRVLVDIFQRQTHPEDEMLARDAFARAHDIRYMIVPPGHSFGLEDLKQALDKEAA